MMDIWLISLFAFGTILWTLSVIVVSAVEPSPPKPRRKRRPF